MTQAAVHSPSRPFNPWLFLALPLGLAALLLAFEPVTLDLALANLMYDPGAGFIGRHSWFLENILHDRVKQLVIAISVLGLLVSIAGLFHRPWRALSRPLAYVFLAMSLAASIVTPLKALTAVQCPWSLAQFGGEGFQVRFGQAAQFELGAAPLGDVGDEAAVGGGLRDGAAVELRGPSRRASRLGDGAPPRRRRGGATSAAGAPGVAGCHST